MLLFKKIRVIRKIRHNSCKIRVFEPLIRIQLFIPLFVQITYKNPLITYRILAFCKP